jgi:hypothetical protein
MTKLARREPIWDPMLEYQLRYFRMYLHANAAQRPAPDGSWLISDLDFNDAPEFLLDRPTPYSTCTGHRKTASETVKV